MNMKCIIDAISDVNEVIHQVRATGGGKEERGGMMTCPPHPPTTGTSALVTPNASLSMTLLSQV